MGMLDLSQALVLCDPQAVGAEAKAGTVLVDEVKKRSGLSWRTVPALPKEPVPVIVLGTKESVSRVVPPHRALVEESQALGPEGCLIQPMPGERPVVYVIGADARGALYGVGRLLRNLYIRPQSVTLDAGFRFAGTPLHALRGHQLGYRPKTNAYDAWTVERFEQYIRELALFGANSIEVLPPRTDDAATSPHMIMEPLEMMVKLATIINSYGLDTWIWYPNMAEDYTDPDTVRIELEEREDIFRRLPSVKAVFIPGGDPGDVQEDVLFQWAGQVADVLQRHHPQAKVWLSPQIMRNELVHEWLSTFYDLVRQEPSWLGGVVFAPWERAPLPELRRIIPEKYPIRCYPDICHNHRCQYPVPEWDVALAITHGRESINPRPAAFKHVQNQASSFITGTITYSEGVYDDVNKFVWADQDWDPRTEVVDTLRDYARLFISCDYTEEIAQGILALERNWQGPLLLNEGVDMALTMWQDLECKVPSHVLGNYRFQMPLLRAYYDAYQRRRLVYETELECETRDILRSAEAQGSLAAGGAMELVLSRAKTAPVAKDYRQRCDELADALFAGIGAQTTVERHGAHSLDRGAFMSSIDTPLNDVNWLLIQAEKVRLLNDEQARLSDIKAMLDRTNPGPGGFYDDLGTPGSMRRLANRGTWAEDPGRLASACVHHEVSLVRLGEEEQRRLGGVPLAWVSSVSAIYDAPLKVVYKDLDRDATYKIRVTYTGKPRTRYLVRLVANGTHVIHEEEVVHVRIVESPIPRAATATGTLELSWHNLGGDRARDIAEIWLMRGGVPARR
jgi:hypothetical protein